MDALVTFAFEPALQLAGTPAVFVRTLDEASHLRESINDNLLSGSQFGRGVRMDRHRFGRKIKLPSTFAIKNQIRKLMANDGMQSVEAPAARRSGDVVTKFGSSASWPKSGPEGDVRFHVAVAG